MEQHQYIIVPRVEVVHHVLEDAGLVLLHQAGTGSRRGGVQDPFQNGTHCHGILGHGCRRARELDDRSPVNCS